MYGKRQKLVKTAFKILITSADTSKTPQYSHQNNPSFSAFASVQTQVAQKFEQKDNEGHEVEAGHFAIAG